MQLMANKMEHNKRDHFGVTLGAKQILATRLNIRQTRATRHACCHYMISRMMSENSTMQLRAYDSYCVRFKIVR